MTDTPGRFYVERALRTAPDTWQRDAQPLTGNPHAIREFFATIVATHDERTIAGLRLVDAMTGATVLAMANPTRDRRVYDPRKESSADRPGLDRF